MAAWFSCGLSLCAVIMTCNVRGYKAWKFPKTWKVTKGRSKARKYSFKIQRSKHAGLGYSFANNRNLRYNFCGSFELSMACAQEETVQVSLSAHQPQRR